MYFQALELACATGSAAGLWHAPIRSRAKNCKAEQRRGPRSASAPTHVYVLVLQSARLRWGTASALGISGTRAGTGAAEVVMGYSKPL